LIWQEEAESKDILFGARYPPNKRNVFFFDKDSFFDFSSSVRCQQMLLWQLLPGKAVAMFKFLGGKNE
jgi:hypothetical protein